MRILIIGAGVLGSNLAKKIKKGNDVTILARNKTYENLKNNGLIIKHKLGKKSVDHFNVIDKLEENDIYDVIFVVSRFSSLDSIVKIIEKFYLFSCYMFCNHICFSGDKFCSWKKLNK